MVARLKRLYESWEENPDIEFVLMKGSGKAFCSGADVVALHQLIEQGKAKECKSYFETLYKFVYLQGTYLKPHVAILDGFTMGSGAGISLSGMFRLVTDRTCHYSESNRVSVSSLSFTLEVLKEVLDAVDPQNPEGARDEFTLDLVEQCSFQKQRLMQVVMSSRDEKETSRAIELNEKLQKALERHVVHIILIIQKHQLLQAVQHQLLQIILIMQKQRRKRRKNLNSFSEGYEKGKPVQGHKMKKKNTCTPRSDPIWACPFKVKERD